jgi:hypothetical protein
MICACLFSGFRSLCGFQVLPTCVCVDPRESEVEVYKL